MFDQLFGIRSLWGDIPTVPRQCTLLEQKKRWLHTEPCTARPPPCHPHRLLHKSWTIAAWLPWRWVSHRTMGMSWLGTFNIETTNNPIFAGIERRYRNHKWHRNHQQSEFCWVDLRIVQIAIRVLFGGFEDCAACQPNLFSSGSQPTWGFCNFSCRYGQDGDIWLHWNTNSTCWWQPMLRQSPQRDRHRV